MPSSETEANVSCRKPSLWHAGAVLSALMAFASISTDFYLPAMPEMARDLGAAPGRIELTITDYLIGISLGQLFWGAHKR